MFERFEELSVRAILAARDMARRLGHMDVGTEHIVLGLAKTQVAVDELLDRYGTSPWALESAIVAVFGEGRARSDEDLPFAADAQRALAVSWAVAEELHHSTIAPLHLLLAILRLDDTRALQVLQALHVEPAALADAARDALAPASQTRGRAGFQEDDIEVSTEYGPVVLTLLRRPDAAPQAARVISLSADTLKGPDEVYSFLAQFDRLLDASGGRLGVG
ncbi:MAG: hypothetical protein KGR26_13765 [Cyanobacteria bacterium REEB65]|nr:hypothetical protein [Cyanobacteria bacterium REEB65]